MEAPRGISPAHESWFSVVLAEASAIFVLIDEDFRIRFLSDAGAKFLSFPVKDSVGVSVYDVMPREHAEERRRLNERLIQTRSAATLIETLRGWKCRTRVAYFGQDEAGKHMVAVVIHPQRLQPIGLAGMPMGEVLYASDADAAIFARLSKAELRVLTLIGDGLTTQQIADRVGRAPKTIEGHRHSIGKKLGANNRVELARIAIRAGLSSLASEQESEPAPEEQAWTRRRRPPADGRGRKHPPAN